MPGTADTARGREATGGPPIFNRTRFAALAVVSILALAGCGGGEPEPTKTAEQQRDEDFALALVDVSSMFVVDDPSNLIDVAQQICQTHAEGTYSAADLREVSETEWTTLDREERRADHEGVEDVDGFYDVAARHYCPEQRSTILDELDAS